MEMTKQDYRFISEKTNWYGGKMERYFGIVGPSDRGFVDSGNCGIVESLSR